jgi:hypothetical protein
MRRSRRSPGSTSGRWEDESMSREVAQTSGPHARAPVKKRPARGAARQGSEPPRGELFPRGGGGFPALVFLANSEAARRLASAWESLDPKVRVEAGETDAALYRRLLDLWAETSGASPREARHWAPVLLRTGICSRDGLHPVAARYLEAFAFRRACVELQADRGNGRQADGRTGAAVGRGSARAAATARAQAVAARLRMPL